MKGAYTDAPFIIYAIKETSENLFVTLNILKSYEMVKVMQPMIKFAAFFHQFRPDYSPYSYP